jgi:hypothetical protein
VRGVVGEVGGGGGCLVLEFGEVGELERMGEEGTDLGFEREGGGTEEGSRDDGG